MLRDAAASFPPCSPSHHLAGKTQPCPLRRLQHSLSPCSPSPPPPSPTLSPLLKHPTNDAQRCCNLLSPCSSLPPLGRGKKPPLWRRVTNPQPTAPLALLHPLLPSLTFSNTPPVLLREAAASDHPCSPSHPLADLFLTAHHRDPPP